MIFLGIKGFGDLAILISYLNKCQESHTILIRGGLEQMAKSLLKNKHNLIVLKNVYDVFPLYSLRNISLKSLCKIILGALEIRKILFDKKDVVIIDFESVRNNIFYFGIRRKYLCMDSNIYSAYRDLLFVDVEAARLKRSESIFLAFPLGSVRRKHIYNNDLKKICETNKINVDYVTVVLYKSHSEYAKEYNDFNVKIYSNINELIKFFEKCDAIISVDTFQLHLAVLMHKPLLAIGSVNANFHPPYAKISERTK